MTSSLTSSGPCAAVPAAAVPPFASNDRRMLPSPSDFAPSSDFRDAPAAAAAVAAVGAAPNGAGAVGLGQDLTGAAACTAAAGGGAAASVAATAAGGGGSAAASAPPAAAENLDPADVGCAVGSDALPPCCTGANAKLPFTGTVAPAAGGAGGGGAGWSDATAPLCSGPTPREETVLLAAVAADEGGGGGVGCWRTAALGLNSAGKTAAFGPSSALPAAAAGLGDARECHGGYTIADFWFGEERPDKLSPAGVEMTCEGAEKGGQRSKIPFVIMSWKM